MSLTIEKTKTYCKRIIPWLLAVISLVYAVYFINYNYFTLMNGDTSSELVLSKLLAEEGRFISENWFYSTELRVLNTQIIYRFAFLLFPNDWKMVRIISDVVMLIILVACYLFMMSSLNMSKEGKWTAWMLFLPFGANYGYMIVYGAFYIPHICISFISIGLIALIIKAENRRLKIIYLSLLVIVALLSGMGGARQALVCYIPVVLSGMLDLSINYLNKQERPYRLFGVSVVAFFAYMLGIVINTKVLHKVYFFTNQADYRWEEISLTNLITVIGDLISVYGFNFHDVSFMGVYGVVNFLVLGVVLLGIISLIVLFKRFGDLDYFTRFYLLFSCISVLFCAFIYSSCIDAYSVNYWIPIMIFFYPIILCVYKVEKDERLRSTIPFVIGYTVLTFLLASHITLKNPIEARTPLLTSGSKFGVIKDELKELPEKGFAPFWVGNCITELADGKAEIWITDDITFSTIDDVSCIMKWLQKKDHAKALPDGDFFIITYGRVLDDPEYPAYTPLFWDEAHMVYADDNFTIFTFENYEDYRNTLTSVAEQDAKWRSQ